MKITASLMHVAPWIFSLAVFISFISLICFYLFPSVLICFDLFPSVLICFDLLALFLEVKNNKIMMMVKMIMFNDVESLKSLEPNPPITPLSTYMHIV